jgi:hypothetical protein
MPAYRVESKKKRSNPESCRGHHASPQVAYHYAVPGDTIHFAHECDCGAFGKVMQNLRRQHDIHARVGERK